ncbi:hypothetical protein SAE02_05710 [Skermanella aerolata]|uniref:Uncharacterized protein n=1 Tax=Skermanella aerolata TaxID=393310 RepID=A0A512DIW3_9PROT|nr:hypothetical protein [Skermanella aerolata]GEO36423.1 hypothetical protein SAE02_05710 [Skermanella aerolata]
MAHSVHLRERPTRPGRTGIGMPVLLAVFALAVLGLFMLAKPADRAAPRPAQETATTPPQQDWHGNYNMVRR